MNKVIRTLLIILLSLVIIALTVTMIFFIKNDFSSFNIGNVEMKLVDSYETDLSSVNRISTDLNSADIEIKKSKNEKIALQFYSNTKSSITVDNANYALSVAENKDNSSGIFINTQKKLVVFVPEAYGGEFSRNTHSGDITVENDLSKNIVKVSSHSGDIRLSNTGDVNIATNSGDISIAKIDYKASVVTSSGNIEIHEFNLKEASELTASSGDVEIKKLDMINNLNITTSSGDVEIEKNNSTCYVETKTDSGSVNVKNSDRKSDIVLNITTSSGDIEVE